MYAIWRVTNYGSQINLKVDQHQLSQALKKPSGCVTTRPRVMTLIVCWLSVGLPYKRRVAVGDEIPETNGYDFQIRQNFHRKKKKQKNND